MMVHLNIELFPKFITVLLGSGMTLDIRFYNNHFSH
jgi:hypothetical protein